MQDIVRTGTCENHHYVIYRTEPHWFRADVYGASGKMCGTTRHQYTIKKAWSDAIAFIAVYLSKRSF